MNSYEVSLDNKVLGYASVESTGLYYNIFCRCNGIKPERYRLRIVTETDTHDLGICQFDESGLYLNKQIPRKRITGAICDFKLIRYKNQTENIFVPVSEKSEFNVFANIIRCRFAKENGRIGVYIRESP